MLSAFYFAPAFTNSKYFIQYQSPCPIRFLSWRLSRRPKIISSSPPANLSRRQRRANRNRMSARRRLSTRAQAKSRAQRLSWRLDCLENTRLPAHRAVVVVLLAGWLAGLPVGESPLRAASSWARATSALGSVSNDILGFCVCLLVGNLRSYRVESVVSARRLAISTALLI